MQRFWRFAATAGLVAAGCTSGIDPDAAQAALVNQVGGKVAAGSTASVTVGAGALADQITVVVAPGAVPPVAPPAPAVSKVVEFLPHGTTFAVPARITLKYTSASRNLRVLRLAERWSGESSGAVFRIAPSPNTSPTATGTAKSAMIDRVRR